MTIDRESWGYRHNANISSYYTTKELVKLLIETVRFVENNVLFVFQNIDSITQHLQLVLSLPGSKFELITAFMNINSRDKH